MSELEQLQITLKADLTEIQKALRKVNDSVENLDVKTKKVGKGFSELSGLLKKVGIVASFTAVVGASKKAIDAFSQQEKAVISLNQALQSTGQFSEQVSAALQQNASDLQNITTFGDEGIIQATATLQSFAKTLTGAELKSGQQAIVALAAATGTSLESAAQALGKTLGSATNSLKDYGVELDVNASASDKLAAAQQQLQPFFDQAKAQTDTLEGSYKQLSNSTGDLFESFGSIITQGLDLPNVFGDSKDAVEAFNTILQNDFANGLIKSIRITGELGKIVTQLAVDVFQAAQKDVERFVSKFLKVWNFLADGTNQVFQEIKVNILDNLMSAFQAARALTVDFVNNILRILDRLSGGLASRLTEGLGSALARAGEKVGKFGKDFGKNLQKSRQSTGTETFGGDLVKNITASFKNSASKIREILNSEFSLAITSPTGAGGLTPNLGNLQGQEAGADDRQKLQLINLESQALQQKAQDLQIILNLKREDLALSKEQNAATLATAGKKGALNIQRQELQAAKDKVLREKDLEILRAGNNQAAVAAAKQSKIELSATFALRQKDLESQLAAVDIADKKRRIEADRDQLIRDANNANEEALQKNARELNVLKAKSILLQGQSGKEAEIAEIKNKITDNLTEQVGLRQEIKIGIGSINEKTKTQLTLLEQQANQLAAGSKISREAILLQLKQLTEMGKINSLMQESENKANLLKQATDGFGNSLSSAFKDGKFQADQFFNSLLNVGLNTLNSLVQNYAQQIPSLLSGGGASGGGLGGGLGGLLGGLGGGGGGGAGGLFGGLISKVGGLFGGAFASGGIAPGGKVSLVGENGPELAYFPTNTGILNSEKTRKLFTSPADPSQFALPSFSPSAQGAGLNNNSSQKTVIMNINIRALDGKDVVETLSEPGTQRFLKKMAVDANNKASHRVFQLSTAEPGGGR